MKKIITFAFFLSLMSCDSKWEKKTEDKPKAQLKVMQNKPSVQEKVDTDPLIIKRMMALNKKLSYSQAKSILDMTRLSLKGTKVSLPFALAVMETESTFNHSVVSHKGAAGLMQLMPHIRKEYNIDIYSVEGNIRAGILHLDKGLKANGYDPVLALAAYNAGQSRVNSGRWKTFPETVSYVNKVSQREKLYRNIIFGR